MVGEEQSKVLGDWWACSLLPRRMSGHMVNQDGQSPDPKSGVGSFRDPQSQADQDHICVVTDD